MNYRNILYVNGHPDYFAGPAYIMPHVADLYIEKIRQCIEPGKKFAVQVYYNKTYVRLKVCVHKTAWNKLTILSHSFEPDTPLDHVLDWAHLSLVFT